MGFLSNLRTRDPDRGVAIAFWTLAGGGAGIGLANWVATGAHGQSLALDLGIIGGVLGMLVGLYAALGSSWLAWVLALPSIILILWW